MGDPALNLALPAGLHEMSWPMRRAQQAFALLLEDSRRYSGFRVAPRRSVARTALSAVSVDDRGPLERWIALQLLTAAAGNANDSLGVLATVDTTLAAAVRAQLPRLAARFARSDATDATIAA